MVSAVRCAVLSAVLAISGAQPTVLNFVGSLDFPPASGAKNMTTLFAEYCGVHGKAYAGAEHAARLATFSTHHAFVTDHNQRAAKGEFSFTLGVHGPFADMTNADYAKMLTLRSAGASLASAATGLFDASAVADVPAAWDWRDHKPSPVTPVKNQGSCGSCWAFSAVATMEGAHNLKTGKLETFSEQQLVDCVNGGANTCSIGGEMYQGVVDVISRGGIESESDYPYKGSSGHTCTFDKTKSAATFSAYRNVTSGDEAALKAATYAQPIISVGIDASSPLFQLYFGGVYDHAGCKNAAEQLDHGVAVVGYGSATTGIFSKTTKDYWVVRNSWGASWGKSGYIWMVRNKSNQCGVATQACFAEV